MTKAELELIKNALGGDKTVGFNRHCKCDTCRAITIVNRELKLKEIEKDPSGKHEAPND